MGADIHDYLEVRQDGRWTYAGDNAFPGNEDDTEKHSPFDGARNYDLFGFLADVRNYSEIKPIAEPRGLPGDITTEVREALADDWMHSRSWLSLSELLAYDYDQVVEDRRRAGRDTLPEGEGEKQTLREFLGEWYFNRLDLMRQFGDPHDVRVVFAFDN